jgi:hypothetical protein
MQITMAITIENPITGLLTKKKRPFGVWFLVIYHGLFAGLAPMSLTIFILLYEKARSSSGLTLSAAYPSILLWIGVVVSAFLAWRGNNIGRFAFIILVALHHGGIARNNIWGLQEGIVLPDQQYLTYGRIIRSVFWIIIIPWYFLSKNARAFYATEEK